MADDFFQPVSGMDLPRFAGVPSFFRLPALAPDHPRLDEVELGVIGVPWDGGTTNRPGARHGPRALRDATSMVRARHPATGLAPFATARCADLGDIGPNPVSLEDTMERVQRQIGALVARGITPLAIGGDHLISLPLLRGVRTRHPPLGMIHFDAHTDLFESYFGGWKLTHGTPFRRAIEEGLLAPTRCIQIGIRGTAYDFEDREWGLAQGVRIVPVEEMFELGPERVMDEARAIVGDGPVHVSFDIDFLDPSVAPGTGTPEIGGPGTFLAQQMLRRLSGLDLRSADLVEVSPPFDVGGLTAWAGASLAFELLCPLVEAVRRRREGGPATAGSAS